MTHVRNANHAMRRAMGRLPGTIRTLAALLGLLAIGAFQGGAAMVADSQHPLGMSVSFLERTPVDDYLLPGWFLLAIGSASLLTAIGLLLRWRWPWAAPLERSVGYRWPWIGAIAIGLTLFAFEVIELYVVPFHPVMHPLLLAGSLAIVGLGLTRSAREHLRAAGLRSH